MISTLTKTSLVAITALVTTSTAFAAGGMYIGASAGPGETKLNLVIKTNTGSTLQDSNKTTSNISYKMFGGYRFSPYFGTELQFARLGKINAFSESISRDALSLSAIGYVPLTNNIDLMGKAGVVRTFNRTSNVNLADIIDKGQNGVLLGIGAEYKLTSQLALRVEAEHMLLSKRTWVHQSSRTCVQSKFSNMLASVGMRYTF